MSNRSKKVGILLGGAVVVAVIAIATWSGMSSAKPSGGPGSDSFAVGAGEESPDDLQPASPVTRSSPQSTRGGSRLQEAGELTPDEDGAADATGNVTKKSRKKKKGRRSRKSVQQDEEEAAQKKAPLKKPLPGI